MKKAVIIVAGGKGERMQSDTPKQFIEINGLPILMHTILTFERSVPQIQIVVVLPKNQLNYWNELCDKHTFKVSHEVALGGETRFHSVKNGMEKTNAELIAIHDGVRPQVSKDTIERCFDAAEKVGAAIPVIELTDSIRIVDNLSSKAVDRSQYRLVQTPQVFKKKILQNAYKQGFNSGFTDDASVVEAAGNTITLVKGNRENIKITTPFDLLVAGLLLK